MELYLKVRLAVSEGMSQRQAAKHFNISRDSVAKPVRSPDVVVLAISASSFYVAVTRAEQSVAIVVNDAGSSSLPFWNPTAAKPEV